MPANHPRVTSVPLIDLKQQHAALHSELEGALRDVLQAGQFILGPFVERFEKALATYCEVKHAIAISSGTDALLVALMALDIGPGDEVITSPFTFFATAGVISRTGATPVFVDIDPTTMNLDPAQLEQARTEKTRAVMPVHLFGLSADMQAIQTWADKHGLPVIEDAAQAIGARCHGRMVGSIGLAGCLSFYPTKNLAGLGEGGAVVTNDDAFAHKIRLLRNHGMDRDYEHEIIGGNFRMHGFQGAALAIKLDHLPSYTQARGANAKAYLEAWQDLPIGLPVTPAHYEHVYNQFTVRIPDGGRDAFMAYLSGKQIGHRVYYPKPVHLQPCYASLKYEAGSRPHSEQASAEVVSLPVYPEMSQAERNYVIQTVRAYFNK